MVILVLNTFNLILYNSYIDMLTWLLLINLICISNTKATGHPFTSTVDVSIITMGIEVMKLSNHVAHLGFISRCNYGNN